MSPISLTYTLSVTGTVSFKYRILRSTSSVRNMRSLLYGTVSLGGFPPGRDDEDGLYAVLPDEEGAALSVTARVTGDALYALPL